MEANTTSPAGLKNSTRPLRLTSVSGCRASENFDISSINLIFPKYANTFFKCRPSGYFKIFQGLPRPDQTAQEQSYQVSCCLLGPYCLQYRLPKDISRREEQMTKVLTSSLCVNPYSEDKNASDNIVC